MKQKKLLIVIVAFSIIATFIVGVFRLNAQTVPLIEKRIGNTIYELDTIRFYYIKNKANKITHQEYSNSSYCRTIINNVEQAYSDWLENFKPVFSKERAKELNQRINITCVFDTTGQIQEVNFLFYDREIFEMFKLSEIKAMEDALKKYRYKDLSWYNCGDAKYSYLIYGFNPYLLYYEKTK